MRGLKQLLELIYQIVNVASFTDAWIETPICPESRRRARSHLLQMRGLKLKSPRNGLIPLSRIFYRCVDWNCAAMARFWRLLGRIFYRCVDWNRLCRTEVLTQVSRIFYRCVDWNSLYVQELFNTPVASFTDAWIETAVWRAEVPWILSHLLQMRGLKPKRTTSLNTKKTSHLLQMRGLKLVSLLMIFVTLMSHLLQMRGLKPNENHRYKKDWKSHLLQMRGLKLRHGEK